MSDLSKQARELPPKAYGKAARLYERALFIEADQDVDDATGYDAAHALGELERKYTGIEDVATIGADEWVATQQTPAQQRASGAQKAKRKPKPPPAPRRPSSSSSSSRSRRRTAGAFGAGYLLGGRRTRRAAEATGLPAAGRSATSSVLYVIGAVVALAVFYDLTTSSQAAALVASGIDKVAKLLIEPIDPIAQIGGKRAAATSSSGIAPITGSTGAPLTPAQAGNLAGAGVSGTLPLAGFAAGAAGAPGLANAGFAHAGAAASNANRKR